MKFRIGNPDLPYYFKGIVVRWDGLIYWNQWGYWKDHDIGSTVIHWGLGPFAIDVWRMYSP